ncbi:thyrotropin-releasing hormone receptor [Elysia marginata]|uniref:Thyrotropin-releasing hormone receptor n=1 Tax=Elysia marginata TaxID=1093978 RepID=A0AAV4GH18_9GAST|nr:thyrotropin-releasing hormone receptor [Elysia marginata]
MTGVFFTLIVTLLGVMRTSRSGVCTTEKRFKWFYLNVWLYINVALFLFIPFALIAFLTAFIIHGLRKSRRHRMTLILKDEGGAGAGEEMQVLNDGTQAAGGGGGPRKSRSSSTPATPTAAHNKRMLEETARVERTITLMLIAAGLIFLVLSLPMAVYVLIRGLTVHRERTVENMRWTLYQNIAFLLIDSTHAVNFFLYFFTAKRFRVQLLRIVTCRASCWGRRIAQRGRKGGPNGKQEDLRRGSRFTTTSQGTTSSCLTSNGPRGSTAPLSPVSE